MSTALTRKYVKLAVISGGVVGADQLSKAAVLSWLPLHHTVPIAPGFFNLTHVRNVGGAFGFMAFPGSGVSRLIFCIASLGAIALILHFIRKLPNNLPWLEAGLALILGGALGNLIDRLRHGNVVDFLDLHLGGYHWPAFNVADSAISIGALTFLLHLLLRKIPD